MRAQDPRKNRLSVSKWSLVVTGSGKETMDTEQKADQETDRRTHRTQTGQWQDWDTDSELGSRWLVQMRGP
jgi:hypothetical protein